MDDAVSALQIAESQSMRAVERDALGMAWRELVKQKPAWSVQYGPDLLLLFEANQDAVAHSGHAPLDTASSGPREAQLYSPSQAAALSAASPGGFPSHSAFSLMDDAHVSQTIESSRLLQQVLPAVENTLAELNKLISTVQGLGNVRPELNPMRPEIFTQALRGLISATPVEPTMASLWLKYLADPLGRELKRVYERVVNQLEMAHVQGASYRVLPTPVAAGRGRAGRAGDGPGAAGAPDGRSGQGGGNDSGNGGGGGGARNSGFDSELRDEPSARQPSQYADLSNYEIRDELFQDFLFHGGSHAQQGLAPSYYATVDEELVALQATPDSTPAGLGESRRASLSEYQKLPVVDRPPRFVNELSQLNQQVWGAYGRPKARAMVRTQLKKEAQRVGQVLGLEVVRKLVNQVAQDPRLLVPVREAIVALEPSLLRLAMVDPRFFSDEDHAGREIMERVAQRSFKYNDEFSPEFLAFFEPVTRAFNELNGQTIDDTRPFSLALATLESGWDAQDQHEAENRHNVVHALRFAEERQALADQISFELSSRSDLEKVPGMVLDFLLGPWALAMAHAKLTDTRNQIDPEGFRSVVPDLLWSVKRDVTLKQPAKLIEMIPGLLGKLHAGLALMGQDPRESEAFFESLMHLHQPVLKLRRLKSQRDAEESGAAPLEPEELPATPEQRRARVAAHPWLGREDLDAAGFEDTLPSAPAELMPLDAPEDEAAAGTAGDSPADLGADEPESALPADTPATAAAPESAEPAAPSPPDSPTATPVVVNEAEAERLLFSLHAGCWVDLYSKRRWLRAQLIWASTKGTLFMFVSHGGQPHSMTKRSCERLIREHLLRPVDTHGVVEQALEVVASEVTSAAQSESQRD